jgi:hypothetical protein
MDAMMTRVLAAEVMRIERTKEMVLIPKKSPATIPTAPSFIPSLKERAPWAQVMATVRVHAVRSPRQKTRTQGSELTMEMRRASGLRTRTAVTMSMVPRAFGDMGFMGDSYAVHL